MNDPLLEEFLTHEVDDRVRAELLGAISSLGNGRQYFTYNAFNVLLDADSGTATVEDELDVDRQTAVTLDGLVQLLAGVPGEPDE